MTDEKVLYLPDGEVKAISEDAAMPRPVCFLLGLVVGIVFLLIVAATVTRDAKKPQSSTATPPTVTSDSGMYITIPGGAWEVEHKREEAEAKKKQRLWDHRPHLDAPVDAPPELIKVGPFFYTVNWTSKAALDSQGAYAVTLIEMRQIWLNPERIASLRDDLTHELMHCARDLGTGGGRFDGTRVAAMYGSEEVAIEGVSMGFLQIMQDNPELVEWLRRK